MYNFYSNHSTLYVTLDFIQHPENGNYFDRHVFPCHCQAGKPNISVYFWGINGILVNTEDPHVVNITILNGTGVLELNLTKNHNLARVQCFYFQNNGSRLVESDQATLRVQGSVVLSLS